jgi:hypothetical protein
MNTSTKSDEKIDQEHRYEILNSFYMSAQLLNTESYKGMPTRITSVYLIRHSIELALKAIRVELGITDDLEKSHNIEKLVESISSHVNIEYVKIQIKVLEKYKILHSEQLFRYHKGNKNDGDKLFELENFNTPYFDINLFREFDKDFNELCAAAEFLIACFREFTHYKCRKCNKKLNIDTYKENGPLLCSECKI